MKGDLALGFVPLDAVVQRSLQLTNSGLNISSYRVEVEAGLPIQVTPADGKLSPKGTPGSTCSLKVELTAEISGPLSGGHPVVLMLSHRCNIIMLLTLHLAGLLLLP